MYWDYAGGPATDLLVHTFTPIFCILQLGYPERVFGGGGTFEFNREVPDQCNIIADYPGGPSVVMTNSLSNHVPADTIVRGTDGIITWGMLQGGKEYGVRIVPFGKGKEGDSPALERAGRYQQAVAGFVGLRPHAAAAQVQHRHGCSRASAALDGHPLPSSEQGREVREDYAADRAVVRLSATSFRQGKTLSRKPPPSPLLMCHRFERQPGIWGKQGRTSADDFLPYFSSKAIGDVMQKVMQTHPRSYLLVLCGHTHGDGQLQVLDNLRVLTGDAEYGKLKLLRRLEVA